ncbi:MAG: hypothetical protein WBW14_12205, partial [Candidatus Acidiferrum sp.]
MAALSEKELGATHAINCKQTNPVEAIHRSVNDANVWFVYENWRSPEGFDPPFQVRLIGFLGGNAAPCIVVGEFTVSEVTAQLRYGHWKRTSLQRIG